MLSIQNVTKWFESRGRRQHVLDDIVLEIEAGEFVTILGPSGCGKSTLLNIVAGIEAASSGCVRRDGETVARPGRDRGFVFQSPALYPWLDVESNVGFGLRVQGVGKRERRRRVNEYLEMVGLSDYRHLRPYELSGGMKQRAAIARVLVSDPSIILMDEPFGALDAFTRRHMQDNIRKIWEETGKTILFVTHDVEEALLLGTRVVVMAPNPGRVEEDAQNEFGQLRGRTAREVRSAPPFVAKREQLIDVIEAMQADTLQ